MIHTRITNITIALYRICTTKQEKKYKNMPENTENITQNTENMPINSKNKS